MGPLRAFSVVASVAALLQTLVVLVSAQVSNSSRWQTLSGEPPLVIAQGGFSGVLPDSTNQSYSLASQFSLPNVVMWCDVQLTKDNVGICFPDLKLSNASNIIDLYPKEKKSYLVNGVRQEGWFSVDYTFGGLTNVSVNSTDVVPYFNYNENRILKVEQVAQISTTSGLWLNIEHDGFYRQHNLSMRGFVLSVSSRLNISYISSPEIAFLRRLSSSSWRRKFKLVFRFPLNQAATEPSTNRTYGSLLRNLALIKTFASAILVPKSFIWPVDENLYLLPQTSLVLDAHREGLEVFASEFRNNIVVPYNYSFDPLAEYLNFIDNGLFSVDGVVSTYPITPSAAIDCFSHLDKKAQNQVNLLIISRNGASGDYPGCTDKAYQKAIVDGVDILDCPVQMAKDGVSFCMSSIDLMKSTSVANSQFASLTTNVPELQGEDGIFTIDLTWSAIKSLKANLQSPFSIYDPMLLRNPKNQKVGRFLTLSEFLAFTKNSSSLKGILITIRNAEYLAKNRRLDVINAVVDAFRDAGYHNQTTETKRVMIRSPDSNVLKEFKKKGDYELLYSIEDKIGGIQNSAVEEMKRFASSVVVGRDSVFSETEGFLLNENNVVPKLKSFKLPVYVYTFVNEPKSLYWDFFGDPTVQINSFFQVAGIDGVITDFPETAARYRRNRCLNRGDKAPAYMQPITPGNLTRFLRPDILSPAEAPGPTFTDSDVAEPPLPPVAAPKASESRSPSPALSASSNERLQAAARSLCVSIMTVLAATFLPWQLS